MFIQLKLTLREHEKIANDGLLCKVNDNFDCNRYRFHSSITLLSGKKDSLACANVNCSQDYSKVEITAIMVCCIDEEVFFSEKVPYMTRLDTN